MRKQEGYTLVELVIIIVILSIIGFIAIPKFAGYSESILVKDAKKLESYLSYAQELSMTKSEPYGLCFNTSAKTFSVNKTDCSSSNIIKSPEDRTSELIINLDSNISISPSGTTSIFFNKRGAPNPDGITITLTYNSKSKVVKVEPKTGFVYEQ
ncbi:MSHA pilin protein MshC [Thermotomaculum hydrothermale]|uniref:Type II secretion system protein H n=1 Tax=Thermotomaculum hydrothermale TaxID=981385 RepID=A0A7R6SYN9_9BACT|nr:GspH/FimT family pseudopilin [Thermotomaculum hydrothermale]BBB32860.1 MSHA pilin protein MshC [Thermotomaculum hydrothermale]